MSEPRDLNLERFSDRDGLRSGHLGKTAQVAYLPGSSSTRLSQVAYAALIDAVFTAPGASEWLSGLRRTVAAWFNDKDSAPHVPPLRLWRP